ESFIYIKYIDNLTKTLKNDVLEGVMSMNSLNYFSNPYPIQPNATFARNGMVATSQPLAADAGMTVLNKGGNAVEAAIATAACLTVFEPTYNGIVVVLFALVWINEI